MCAARPPSPLVEKGSLAASELRSLLAREPLIRLRFASHLLPQGENGRLAAATSSSQSAGNAPTPRAIKFSLASGVRNAECADSVTFSSFVSG